MYQKDDTSYFIVDAHVALWDARPENQRNIHGKQFIDCFYDYHRNLSPESEVWGYDEYLYQGGDRLMKDLFTDGYVDHAIFQPAYLGEFYYKGFGQTEDASELAKAHPDFYVGEAGAVSSSKAITKMFGEQLGKAGERSLPLTLLILLFVLSIGANALIGRIGGLDRIRQP